MPGVSKEQIRQARDTNLFAYLQSSEPGVLKRDGPNYRHREHDSLVYVAAKDYWYWNSRGKKINALDYLMEIRGYGLVEAVNALTDSASSISYHAPVRPKPPPRPPFSLPWAKRCTTGAITYLQRRGIHHQVIGRCMKLGLLYESTYKGSPVCVFVGKDDTGTAKFACMRGMAEPIKQDVYGSDKQFSFCLPSQDPGSQELAVFEAPIDALSHASLQVMQGWNWDGYRLSLGGTSPVALVSFLERHPEIRKVNLYMDNDLAGIVNARKIRRLLSTDNRFRHIRVGIHPPREGKDYNDKLLCVLRQSRDQLHRSRPKEAAISI